MSLLQGRNARFICGVAVACSGRLKPPTCVELLQCAPPGVEDGDAGQDRQAGAMFDAGTGEPNAPANDAASGLGMGDTTLGHAVGTDASLVLVEEAGIALSSSGTPSQGTSDAELATRSCDHGWYWDVVEHDCKEWSSCAPGAYVATEGTAHNDRRCDECPSQTYSTESNQAECQPCNTCGWLGLETACTKSQDAVCGDVSAIKQFGTTGGDNTRALARDVDGNIWVGGWYSIGYPFAFLRAYNATGDAFQDFTFDKAGNDSVTALAASEDGGMWVTGYVAGEAFLSKYAFDEPEPAVRRSFGTTGARVWDVAVDAAGDVWAVGYTSVNLGEAVVGGTDAFVRKYPRNGSSPTTYQFGTERNDEANGVALDSGGNVWVVGTTHGALAGSNLGLGDAFLRKYPADGSAPTTYQFGTRDSDVATSVAVDLDGNTWVGGSTTGAFSGYQAQGGTDAFVRMYPASGAASNTYQFGTQGADSTSALVADAFEGVWVLGYELESGAQEGVSPSDAFIERYIAGKQNAESYSVATVNGSDSIGGGAVDAQGSLWVGGSVAGALVGTSAGGSDAFVSQIAR